MSIHLTNISYQSIRYPTGPAFVKIGQSLSIRTDLLSPAYIKGLTKLQDKVKPFPTPVARRIIERELGLKSVDKMFVGGIGEVVASASLGQVFRATLKADGTDVAIKVQRPDVINNVALDLHLLHQAAPLAKKVLKIQQDFVGLVNSWGTGFVNELDYSQEAANSEDFNAGIRKTSLRDVVFAPGT